jgi:hypothetical protein
MAALRAAAGEDISEQMAMDAGTSAASAAANGKNGHSLISDAKFRHLHAIALQLQLAGKQHRVLRGREAALAGVTADLLPGDATVAEFDAPIDTIARSHSIAEMDAHAFEERVIEALSHALGDRLRKAQRITVIFFNPARSSQILKEARTLAIAAKLPVLLVEHGPAKSANRGSLHARGKQSTLEYPSIPVDSNDVIAMYRVAHEAIARAREGNGPTHIIGVRWHTAEASSRQPGSRAAASRNAVDHLEEWLTARGLPAQEWRGEVIADFAANGDSPSLSSRNAVSNLTTEENTAERAIA